ncbi:putative serpin-Z12 [Dichanthelium oligosanthes]|uniref:Putative serpin-Z12 n=1 Tax=Dichanthelium oligosanthes TaxID=888268 RepID=A0A1E5VGG3_9POAL|nr:putative serpin-Z12 [Dichanthelium oligosanthes]
MTSWRPGGSPPNVTASRHDEHAAMLPAPTVHGAGGSASQQFPVPDITAAIASYLASQPLQPPEPHTCAPRAASVCIDTSRPPPRRHNHAPPQPWPPRHQHRTAPAASPWLWAPTLMPPAPSLLSSWTVPPNMMVPGAAPYDASSGGGAAGVPGDAPGFLRVARRAGSEAASEGRNSLLALVAAGTNGQTWRELLGFLGSGSLSALQRAAGAKLVAALRDLPRAHVLGVRHLGGPPAGAQAENLGVTEAFGGGDFSAMLAGGDGLFISGVYHKATIEVDELGTVAAVATAVSICMGRSARPPVDFVADRPFLFAVVEERTGAVVFFGQDVKW